MSVWKACRCSGVMPALVAVCLGLSWAAAGGDGSSAAWVVPAGTSATVDGSLAEGEWSDALAIPLDGSTTLFAKHADGMLYLGIRAQEMSVGNLMIASADQVRVLHSSAALGTAVYTREADAWQLTTDFVWKCRGGDASAASTAERELFLESEGWVASTAYMGIPGEMEYQVRWREEFERIAFLILPTSRPTEVASWPPDVVQSAIPGPIPSRASFGIDTWAAVALYEPPAAVESPCPGAAVGTIAFSSSRNGNTDIYCMSADGSDLHRVTTARAEDLEPCWAPDGSCLAYQSFASSWRLRTIALDGSDDRALTATLSWSPAWSPDGQWIAYGTGASILRISVADGHTETLVPSCTDCGRPAWSPDGSMLLFHSSMSIDMEIYVRDMKDGALRQLTHQRGEDFLATWSPDGTRIVFTSNRDGNREIYTMRTDGTDVMCITNDPAEDILPSWSPTGEWIAFVTNRDGNREIYLVKPDGSCLHRLTDNPGEDMYPTWKPR